MDRMHGVPYQLNNNQAAFLHQKGFSHGLIRAVANNAGYFPLRLIVLDNSSSMQTNDALVMRGSTLIGLQTYSTTRWDEAREFALGLGEMAATLNLPTRFFMLNDLGSMFGPSTLSIGESGPLNASKDLQTAHAVLGRAYPSGATPLAKHIARLRDVVIAMAPQLSREGKRVSIMIISDGLPSDEGGNENGIIRSQFVQALKSLEGLPVWVAIRLCTNDESVVQFYGSIGVQLNYPYDILDDFLGEALEVYLKNPWINYSLPIHLFRSLGIYIPVLDKLDEWSLSISDLRPLFAVLFHNAHILPDPAANWLAFLYALSRVISTEQYHVNSVTGSLGPYIDLRRLHRIYGGNLKFPEELAQQIPQPQRSLQQPKNVGYKTQNQNNFGATGRSTNHQSSHSASSSRKTNTSQPTKQQQQPQSNSTNNSSSKYGSATTSRVSNGADRKATIRRGIIQWAVLSWNTPQQQLKPIYLLLSAIPQILPPALGVPMHSYFQKWNPLTLEALQRNERPVIQRGLRKAKLFLHPDKLPKDLTPEQVLVCESLWNVLADAWEAFDGN